MKNTDTLRSLISAYVELAERHGYPALQIANALTDIFEENELTALGYGELLFRAHIEESDEETPMEDIPCTKEQQPAGNGVIPAQKTENIFPTFMRQPHIRMNLPDGSLLAAAVHEDDNYPAINLYWVKDPDHPETEEVVAFAEFNPEKDPGHELHIAAYQSDQEDTKYYAPYIKKGGQ